MKYVHEEFIKFQSDFSTEKTDFYGENSPLNKEEFKEFLKEYLAYGKRKYGEDFLCKKAVSKEQIQSAISGVNYFSDLEFFAYKRLKKSKYRNWSFYTDRVIVNDNVVCLKDEYTFPVPATKYEFENGITRLSFAVKIGSDYKAYINRLYDTTTGRQVELRFGCADCIRLFFAPDGTFAYKNGETDRYHPQIIKICEYDFDEWLDVELEIVGSEFSIRVKDKEMKFPYEFEKLPDTLYLGGGMQPTKEWSVKILGGEDGQGEKIKFFKEENECKSEEIPLGKVRLPFVLGTQANKDCELVLRSEFVHENGYRFVLKLDSLDPGGEVFINGVSVVRKDDFQPVSLDVTKWCKEGANSLEIVVFPRAPEILYNWHRHEDYYNGWFSLDVKIEKKKIFILSKPVVRTIKVGKETKFSVFWDIKNTDKELSYSIFLRKSHPNFSESTKLGDGFLESGVLEKEFCFPVDVWCPDNPNLYEIEIKLFEKGEELFSSRVETGFRTIEQKNGGIFLNGKKLVLKGALNMQFLPPYESVPLTHLCPSVEQIAEQLLAVKNMNGNCLRMHQLGYGSNDKRIAKLADRLGVTLIWTTRLLDSVENLQWTDTWKQRASYIEQVKQVVNNPSIIMYEGSNELHTDLQTIDKIYKEFVSAIKEVDDTRLICPVSHLYYGGGLYEDGTYYNDKGTQTESGNIACAPEEWTAKNVLRSAHTYCLLLGYGASWQDMLTQNWKWQAELCNSTERAYIVSEFAVIGRQNPNVPEAKEFFNLNSYEYRDEVNAFGFSFENEEWELSQAFQAICAEVTVKKLKACGADGMLWCSLWGGANNASYLKPIIDFYGYKKFAYYSLKEGFAKTSAFHKEPQLLWSKEHKISPILYTTKEGLCDVCVEIFTTDGNKTLEKTYHNVSAQDNLSLPSFLPEFSKDGYYVIRYTVEEK